MALQFQKSASGSVFDHRITAAAYNHHVHNNKSCFGKRVQKKTDGNNQNETGIRKRKREKAEECRYRVPRRPNSATKIINATTSKVKWYRWDGSYEEIDIKDLIPKRAEYDAFQNICCPAISYSKLTCNTNLSPVMKGPMAQYTFKYNMKCTQEEDGEEYHNLSLAIQKNLSRERRSDSDFSEAITRILCGSHAHQSTNIIGPALAAYLTRNKSRFIFSHETIWCPLLDIKALLHGDAAFVSIQHTNNKTPFLQCVALHYLCRPLELEDLTVYDFFSEYEVVRCTGSKTRTTLSFCNGTFQHSSYSETNNRFKQEVKKRDKKLLPRIRQWDFPDSASFGGNIMLASPPFNSIMESYSEMVLLYFFSYRQLEDIQVYSSYVAKLQEVVSQNKLPERYQIILQNILDAKSNNCRTFSDYQDDLQRCTTVFQPTFIEYSESHQEDDEDEEDNNLEGKYLDALLRAWDDEAIANEEDTDAITTVSNEHIVPKAFELNALKQRGAHMCGFEYLGKLPRVPLMSFDTCFDVQTMAYPQIDPGLDADDIDHSVEPTQKSPNSLRISP